MVNEWPRQGYPGLPGPEPPTLGSQVPCGGCRASLPPPSGLPMGQPVLFKLPYLASHLACDGFSTFLIRTIMEAVPFLLSATFKYLKRSNAVISPPSLPYTLPVSSHTCFVPATVCCSPLSRRSSHKRQPGGHLHRCVTCGKPKPSTLTLCPPAAYDRCDKGCV